MRKQFSWMRGKWHWMKLNVNLKILPMKVVDNCNVCTLSVIYFNLLIYTKFLIVLKKKKFQNQPEFFKRALKQIEIKFSAQGMITISRHLGIFKTRSFKCFNDLNEWRYHWIWSVMWFLFEVIRHWSFWGKDNHSNDLNK
jgi:hypothetical protein